MSTDEIQIIVDRMEPGQAASVIADAMKGLWPVLGEHARLKFMTDVVGDAGQDKVASLVHL